jgi:colicin import membrane protein
MATVVASDSVAEAEPRKAEYLDWDLYRKDYKAWHERERRRKARVAKRAADAAAASTVDPDDEENDAQGIRKAAACAEKLEARRKRRVASQARIDEIEADAQALVRADEIEASASVGPRTYWDALTLGRALSQKYDRYPRDQLWLGDCRRSFLDPKASWRDYAVLVERDERNAVAQREYHKRKKHARAAAAEREAAERASEAEREAAERAAEAEREARERAAAERAAAAAACVKLHKIRRRRRLAADAPRRAHIWAELKGHLIRRRRRGLAAAAAALSAAGEPTAAPTLAAARASAH